MWIDDYLHVDHGCVTSDSSGNNTADETHIHPQQEIQDFPCKNWE